MEQTPASTRLFQSIREKYLRKDQIKSMVYDKNFPIEKIYLNLALIETKEQQEKERKLQQQGEQPIDHILSTFEEIYGTKTSIYVENIFDKCNGQRNNVLVLGRAGIGKSTFCQYVTYRWARGELWRQYELIILIHLRKLTEADYPSGKKYLPIDLVNEEYFPFDNLSKEEISFFKTYFDNGQLLWILDGYDEFAQNSPGHLKKVVNHILDTQPHILTSRPYAITLSYDVKMEITGFTKDNIPRYVERFFDLVHDDIPDASLKGQNLLAFLKSNSSIWGVSHIPVNLELICSLWSDTDWSKTKTLTITALYDNIIAWLCRRHLARKDVKHVQKRIKAIYELCKAELQFLEVLAFKAMESNQIILSPALLLETENDTKYSLDENPELLNIGILKSYGDKSTTNQVPAEQQHYFVHLSFQEHFAARHLLKTFNSANRQKAINFINSYKYNQRFLLVFVFASGLLAQPDNASLLSEFWSTMHAQPIDLIGLKHIKLIIECIEELGDQTVIPQRQNYLSRIAQWLDISTNSPPSSIRRNLLNSLAETRYLCNLSLIQKTLVHLLQNKKETTQYFTLDIISELTITKPLPDLVSALLILLQLENSKDIERNVIKALAHIAEKETTNEVITALLNALGDQDPDVRQRACETLGHIGKKASMNHVIPALLKALQDQDPKVRRAACVVLGKTGDKAPTNEVITALLNALGDQDSRVKQRASEALGRIGERAATNEVITALLNVLGDQDADARWIACAVLGKIGEKAATNEVITALLNALRDQDWKVRWAVCAVLQKIGTKAATNDVIGALLNALHDQHANVRETACEALQTIRENEATNDVISALRHILRDQNSKDRHTACEALGKIDEKASTNDIIATLLNALVDQDSNVRQGGCEALGKIDEKAATNEVITALLNALSDQDSNVRWNVCEALGKIDKKAATSEVITALLSAFRDQDSDVRLIAREALEKILEKAATSTVITGVVNAMKDRCIGKDEWWMRNCLEQAMSSYCGMKELNTTMIEKLYLCLLHNDVELKNIPSNHLVRLFLETQNAAWAPLVAYTALLQGNAVTVSENNVIHIYDGKGVSEFSVCRGELLANLVDACSNLKRNLIDGCIGSYQARNNEDDEELWAEIA